jgi:two-component system, cell cycle response regulator DivK
MHDLSDWQIIIVDDEPDNVGVVKLVMEFHNAEVQTASSGLECLELLSDSTPTLLLIDIQMPEMSGYELLSEIRKHEKWHSIPAIAVTAHTMDGDSARILAAGFDGYIPKPVNSMTLVDEIVGSVSGGHIPHKA